MCLHFSVLPTVPTTSVSASPPASLLATRRRNARALAIHLCRWRPGLNYKRFPWFQLVPLFNLACPCAAWKRAIGESQSKHTGVKMRQKSRTINPFASESAKHTMHKEKKEKKKKRKLTQKNRSREARLPPLRLGPKERWFSVKTDSLLLFFVCFCVLFLYTAPARFHNNASSCSIHKWPMFVVDACAGMGASCSLLAPCLRLHLEDVFGTRVRLRDPICAGTFGPTCVCVSVCVVCKLFPYGRAVFWQSWSKKPCMLIADHSKKSAESSFLKGSRKSQPLQSTEIASCRILSDREKQHR